MNARHLLLVAAALMFCPGCEDPPQPGGQGGAQALPPVAKPPASPARKRNGGDNRPVTPGGDRLTTNKKQPAVAGVEADHIRSMRNLEKIGHALGQYIANSGHTPPSFTMGLSPNGKQAPGLSWRVQLLPFLGEQALYEKFKLDKTWDDPHNKALINEIPAVYVNPNLSGGGRTNYVAIVGYDTAFAQKNGVDVRKMTDPPEQTVLIVESNKTDFWTKPFDLAHVAANPLADIGAFHDRDGTVALFADGKARMITSLVRPEVMRAMYTIAGNDKFDASAITLQTPAAPKTPTTKPKSKPPSTAPAAKTDQAAATPRGSGDVTSPLLDKVARAVQKNRVDDAEQWLCAVCLATDDRAKVQRYLRWSPGLKRPVLAMRWGLGVTLHYPKDQTIRVPDIRWQRGTKVETLTSPPSVPLADSWKHYAGNLGTRTVERLKEPLGSGDLGAVYKVAVDAADGAPLQTVGGKLPGFQVLGLGSSGELLSAARAAGVDVLMVMNLGVAHGNDSTWYTDVVAKTQLYDVAGGASLGALPVLYSRRATSGRTGRAPLDVYNQAIENHLQSLVKIVDTKLRVSAPPNLDAADAARRAAKLAAAQNRERLPALVELHYYRLSGLLKTADVMPHYTKLVGGASAGKLASADAAGRLAALAPLLPQERN